MTALEAHILASARLHDGRFLLAKRFHIPLPHEQKSSVDLQYDICERLVSEGRAEWIPYWSTMRPGIRLSEHPANPAVSPKDTDVTN